METRSPYVDSAIATAPPGSLLCDGSVLSTTSYPDLFAKLGFSSYPGGNGINTFAIPNLINTGKYRRASGPSTVGTTQANQNLSHNHVINISDPAHTHTLSDPSHAHGYTDPTHAHTAADGFGFWGDHSGSAGTAFSAGSSCAANVTTSFSGVGISIHAAFTGIGIFANFTGITSTSNLSGGTEARPETMVCYMCIKY